MEYSNFSLRECYGNKVKSYKNSINKVVNVKML